MSRSETIPQPIPEKFASLTTVRRGHMTTRIPHKFADKNKDLIASLFRRASMQEGK